MGRASTNFKKVVRSGVKKPAVIKKGLPKWARAGKIGK